MEKKLNITKHAIVRYFNRIDRTIAVTDKAYDIWKKDHDEDIKKAEEHIKLMLEGANFITSGNYNGHRRAEYYIYKEELVIFVVAESNLVTLYKVDYGLDQKGNKEMLEVLLKNLSRSYMEEEEFNLNKQEELRKLKYDDDILNRELEQIRAAERALLSKKQEINAKKKTIENKQEELKSRIESIREKIVKSIGALGE